MTTIRSEVLEHLGIDATDLDSSGSTNLDLLINRSWWDILDRFDFKEKQQTTTFSTIAGTRAYSLQTIVGSQIFEAIDSISLVDLNGQHIPLDTISEQWYEEIYNEESNQQAQPTSYFHNNGNIYLYQTPNSIYTLVIWYRYILSDLSSGNPNIPQQWDELIIYGAAARGFRRARDYNSAKEMEQLQELGFARRQSSTAKDDKEVKMSGVQVYRNTYSVRH